MVALTRTMPEATPVTIPARDTRAMLVSLLDQMTVSEVMA